MTDIRKTACVIGASGLVGKALVQQLLVHPGYKQVTCLVRRPLNAADYPDPEGKLQPVVIDFDVLQDYQGYFTVDHVFCALGTTIKKAGSRAAFRRVDFEFIHVCAQLARAQRAKGFVWVSSVGANKHSKNFYLKVKGEFTRSKLPSISAMVNLLPLVVLFTSGITLKFFYFIYLVLYFLSVQTYAPALEKFLGVHLVKDFL